MEDFKIKTYGSAVEDVKAEGVVTIAISRFDNIDRAGDIVRKGAFAKTFKEQIGNIKHLVDHQWTVQSIVGVPLKMWEGDDYAMVESRLIMEKQAAHDLFMTYKYCADNGRQLNHSYGYKVVRTNANATIKGVDIAELKMIEYSTVLRPCNPDTPTLGVKALHGGDVPALLRDIEEVNAMLRKCDFTDAGGAQLEALIAELKGTIDILSHSTTLEPPPALEAEQEPQNKDAAIVAMVKNILTINN